MKVQIQSFSRRFRTLAGLALSACLLILPSVHSQTPYVLGQTPSVHGQTASMHAPGVADEWWTPGFAARVKLAPCDDKICGTIVWAWDDTPTGASDKRPLVGQRIISGMRLQIPPVPPTQTGDRAKSYAGSIYNPEDGQTYKATMRLKTPNTLLVEGCVLFICREQVWRRFDSLKSPPVAALP